KEGGRSSAGGSGFGIGHGRLRKLLITAQVALSLILLIGAGLLIRSYDRITQANPGFDARSVLTLRVSLPNFRYKTPEAITGFYQQLDERVKRLPGVQYVGSNYMLPLSSVALAWEPITVDGFVPKAAGEELIIASSGYVSADYFRAMGIPLLEGRFFNETDTRESPEAVIVDDKLAKRFWPNESALGKRMRRGDSGPWRTVIGVVADAKEYEINAEPAITAFYPLTQVPVSSRFLVVRTTVAPASLIAGINREIRALDAELPTYDISTMEQRLGDSLARRRFAAFLLATFAALALTLAAIGIYGVIAYWVDQRTREIGIRMALGAAHGSILQLVLRQSLAMVGVGLVVGIGGALALTRVMKSLVFGISTTDAVTFLVLPVVLSGVALVASYIPARRALRVDPLVAVRHE
ncbi:MAG: ABC transporter permease, partial [Phycisphaerae bacterium]|nr:ABC transporter permease [Gemmatimonadaceae bacterium]